MLNPRIVFHDNDSPLHQMVIKLIPSTRQNAHWFWECPYDDTIRSEQDATAFLPVASVVCTHTVGIPHHPSS